MRDYEITYIISGSLTEDEASKVTDDINGAITSHSGKVASEDLWGRKRLAYEIEKQGFGWYVVTRFSLGGEHIAELERALRLNAHVIRSLIVRAEEVPSEEEVAKATKAAAAADEAEKKERDKAPKPAAPEVEVEPEKPAKKETAAERKKRQAEVEEKLGKLLNEEE